MVIAVRQTDDFDIGHQMRDSDRAIAFLVGNTNQYHAAGTRHRQRPSAIIVICVILVLNVTVPL